jgi:uncharacterized membrane protein
MNSSYIKIITLGMILIFLGFIITVIGSILSMPTEGTTSGSFAVLIGPIPIIGYFGPQGSILTTINIVLIIVIIAIMIIYEIIIYRRIKTNKP